MLFLTFKNLNEVLRVNEVSTNIPKVPNAKEYFAHVTDGHFANAKWLANEHQQKEKAPDITRGLSLTYREKQHDVALDLNTERVR